MYEMVARNFTIQELPYTRLLHVPDDERDYLSLDEPISLHQLQPHQQYHHEEIYYEIPNVVESTCTTLQYQSNQNNLDGSNSNNNVLEINHVDSSSGTLRTSRKRKASIHDTSDIDDDTVDDSKSVKTNDENKKQNHSEIEKRRRDKMNTYITELSSMIPMCHAMSRKLDKLTVLRMAVQHLKTIRGAIHSYTEGHYKPSFLTDKELKHLILQAADGFLFVVGCDRGRILYVSASVSKVLNYSQGDLLGQSLFDILHPKDVAKVKEQLSSSDLNPRERLIDAKTMLPVKTDVPQGVTRLCPGARRSFFCRMKCKLIGQVKEEADTTTGCQRRKKQNSDKKYNVIQCTGYLKSWTPAKIGLEEQEGEIDNESCNLSCLVAIGRILPQITTNIFGNNQNKASIRNVQFVSRHTLDGKFLFVDQRATLILGFLPQELLGTCMYEYYHHDDIHVITECHKLAIETLDKVNSKIYKFRCKSGSFVRLQTEWKAFKNPWTKDIEYLIAKNNLILTDFRTVESSANKQDGVQENFDFFSQTNGKEMQRMINSHVEASKIGRHIAEQAIDTQRRCGSSSLPISPDPDPESSSIPASSAESHISTTGAVMQDYVPNTTQTYNNARTNNIVTNDNGVSGNNRNDGEIIEMMENAARESPNNGPATDGNDEAAMAVIMSLLEADAGLGGPVDFSGLPWPLP